MYANTVRLLAAYQLGYNDTNEHVRGKLHDAEPRLAGWHAAAQHLRSVALDKWTAEHPEDASFFGYLKQGRELLPEEVSAKVLMDQYFWSVAALAGWTGEDMPTADEIVELQRRLEAELTQKD